MIILHRPWFLRQARSDKYKLSRTACFEAAITDFKIVSMSPDVAVCKGLTEQRQAFHKENPDFFETLLGGSFREFVSVCCVEHHFALSVVLTLRTRL